MTAMSSAALKTAPSATVPVTWAAIGVIMSLLLALGGSVAAFARVDAQVSELRATTEPLRRGDLVKIETDVAWIRQRLEQDQRP